MNRLFAPTPPGPRTREVVEPATGGVLDHVVLSDTAAVHAAIDEATAAQRAWAATSPMDRAAVLRRKTQVIPGGCRAVAR